MPESWKTESREVVFENRWWKIRKDVVRLPDGSTREYFVNEGVDGAIVVPVDAEGRIFLQRMYKHGAGEAVLEFPMGRTEAGEEPMQAAARELKEETGLAGELVRIGSHWVFPSSASTRFHVYLARDAKQVAEPEDNPAEMGEPQWVSATELRALLRDGRLGSLVQAGVGYLALETLGAI